MPIISPLPLTSWPVRAANADAVEIVSVERHQRDAERAGDQQRKVAIAGVGHGQRRETLRERPDERDAVVAEVEDAAAPRSRRTTATSTPGIRGSQRCEHQDQHEADEADRRQRRATASPVGQPVDERRAPRRSGRRRRPRSRTASAAGRPGSSAPGRSCSRSASAWRAGRRRSRAWRPRPTIMIAPTISASIDASAIAALGSPSEPTIGRIVAAIIGPERGVRAEHEDPRRAEDRVADQAQDRGVEAGDGRQPGELGVRHPLRHEQRGQDEPGDDVAGAATSAGRSRALVARAGTAASSGPRLTRRAAIPLSSVRSACGPAVVQMPRPEVADGGDRHAPDDRRDAWPPTCVPVRRLRTCR